MKLRIGDRLPHDFTAMPVQESSELQRNRPVYRVTQVLRETPWSCLYLGKKVFRNCDFKTGQVTEADDDECLDILIRTLAYPHLHDRDWVKARREHMRFEVQSVLGCPNTNLIPEPLDVLEVRNAQDVFTFSRPGPTAAKELVLVFEQIHGEPLDVWRQRPGLTVMRRLDVLSQILEFMAALHAQSLFINAWSPNSFWVDAQDQVHFLGSENVLAAKHSTWRNLFPPDRYSAGFFAPELLDATHMPNEQSDLFSWGTVAWLLLVGESPTQLAVQQQRRWANFEASHRDRLQAELQRVPTQHVVMLAEQFRVSGQRFIKEWPESFLSGLWSCLHVETAQRPGSVAELRSGWHAAPPPAVRCSLAMRGADGNAWVVFSNESLSTELEFVVVGKQGHYPSSLKDGLEIWKGATPTPINASSKLASAKILPSGGAWFYCVFAIDRRDAIENVSRPSQAQRVDASLRAHLIEWADALARVKSQVPHELQLLAQLNTAFLQELLLSKQAVTRGWVIEILGRQLQSNPTHQAVSETLWSKGLGDVEFSLRQLAAGALVRATSPIDADFVTQMAQRLAGENLDATIRAARSLSAFGVSTTIIEQALDGLEGQRLAPCPVCHEQLRRRDHDAHLVKVHRYVPSDGQLVSLGTALGRLWSRILHRFDVASVDELVTRLRDRQSDRLTESLSAALEQQFLRTLKLEWSTQSDKALHGWIEQLGRSLSQQAEMVSACRTLIGHSDGQLRRLAREVLLPSFGKQLAGEGQSRGREFLTVVEWLCPVAVHAERLDTTRRLVAFGANTEAARYCEEELELERLVDCPECGTSLVKRGLGRHRRLEHGAYEWQGKRHSWASLKARLAELAFCREPDLAAAHELVEFLQEKHGTATTSELTECVTDQLQEISVTEDQTVAVREIGTALAGHEIAAMWATSCLQNSLPACRALGLTLFAQGEPTADLAVTIAEHLGDPEVEFGVREAAVVKLVRHAELWPEACRLGLQKFATSLGTRWSGLQSLQALRQWVGQSRILEEFLTDWESKTQLTCSRCQGKFAPTELAQHAREAHGLVLDGLKFRKPWTLALERLETYAESFDLNVLKEGAELAAFSTKDAPSQGRARYWREAIQRKIAVDEGCSELAIIANSNSSAICPECCNLVPLGNAELEPVTITASGDVQSPTVTITYHRVLWLWGEVRFSNDAFEAPDTAITRTGWMVGPVVFGLFAVFVAMSGYFAIASAFAVLGFVGLALAAWLGSSRGIEPVDAAWQVVVPQLLDEDSTLSFDIKRWSFIAGLARVSVWDTIPRRSHASLVRAVDVARQHVQSRLLPNNCFDLLIRCHLATQTRMESFLSSGSLSSRPNEVNDPFVTEWMVQSQGGTFTKLPDPLLVRCRHCNTLMHGRVGEFGIATAEPKVSEP